MAANKDRRAIPYQGRKYIWRGELALRPRPLSVPRVCKMGRQLRDPSDLPIRASLNLLNSKINAMHDIWSVRITNLKPCILAKLGAPWILPET